MVKNPWRQKAPRIFAAALIASSLGLAQSSAEAAKAKFAYPNYYSVPDVVQFGGNAVACQLLKSYRSWVNSFVKELSGLSGGLYVAGHITGTPPGVSASEHTGYGMILSALMAGSDYVNESDPMCASKQPKYTTQQVFDGLMKTYQAHPSSEGSDYLMSWVIQSPYVSGGSQQGPATDGDMDIAYGLILAHKQWGDTKYKTAAEKIVVAIRENEIGSNGLIQSWPGAELARSSDWMLDHIAAFKAYDDDDTKWNKVISFTKSIYDGMDNNTTGLMADFGTVSGSSGSPTGPFAICEHFPTQHFSENASRTPWRLLQYYMHTKDSSIKSKLQKIAKFAKAKTKSGSNYDWSRIKDTYKLNGDSFAWASAGEFDEAYSAAGCSDLSSDDRSEGISKGKNKDRLNFLAPLLSTLLVDGTGSENLKASSQGWQYLSTAKESSGDKYFGDTIRLLTQLTMARLWWAPVKAYEGTQVLNEQSGVEYASLQTAINEASAGSTLVLGPSFTSSTALTISRSGIRIVGSSDGVNQSTLIGPDTSSSVGINIDDGINDVTITGLRLVDWGRAIEVRGARANIDNNRFEMSSNSRYGIYMRGYYGSELDATGNDFVMTGNRGYGIYLGTNSTGTYSNLLRNRFWNGNGGISASSLVSVLHNTIHNASYGISLYDSATGSVVRNSLFNAGYQNIYISGSPSLSFRSNLLYGASNSTMPVGYSDPYLQAANPGLDADLVPSTNAAIDNGVSSVSYSTADGYPDIGAIEVR